MAETRRTRALAKQAQETLRNYAGTQDFLFGDVIARNFVKGFLREIFEEFGFDGQETSALELRSTLTGKYGEEADMAIFLFSKYSDEIGLRYDLTVPLARVVGMKFVQDELPIPYKRYQIAPVWRADKPAVEQGRLREFWQCDADVVGSRSMLADAEIVSLVYTALKRLQLEAFTIRLNDRKILDAMATSAGVTERSQALNIYRAIDKLDKAGEREVFAELLERAVSYEKASRGGEIVYSLDPAGLTGDEKIFLPTQTTGRDDSQQTIGPLKRGSDYRLDPATGMLSFSQAILQKIRDKELADAPIIKAPFLSEKTASRVMELIKLEGSNQQRLQRMREKLSGQDLTGIEELAELLRYLAGLGIEEKSLRVDFTLARGLDYYTGPIFETAVEKPKIGSITGGGRYDALIKQLGGPDLPATGTSFGLERLVTVMQTLDLLPKQRTTVEALVMIFSPESAAKSLEIVSGLRREGIKAEIYLDLQAKLGRQLKYALRKGVPVVVIPGPDELAKGQVAVKDLVQERQELVPLGELSRLIRRIVGRRQ